MADRYPIMVEQYTGKQAFQLGCAHNGSDCPPWTAKDVDEFIGYIEYGHCPTCNSFQVVPAYEEADRCRNCGKLGFFEKVLGYCCSRACMLQFEYAESLKTKGAA